MINTRKIAELAHPMFVANGWEWSSSAGVPTPTEIQSTLDYLVREIRQRLDTTFIATGRFRASKFVDEEGTVEITISLELGNEFR